MCSAWRRTVHYFDDPRFKLLLSTSPDGRDFTFNMGHSNFYVGHVRDSSTCEQCLDPAFAAEAVRLHADDAQAAHRVLSYVLAQLRPGSASVERRHLIAQDLKRPQTRGVAVFAERLAQLTYLKSVSMESETLTKDVQTVVLKRVGMNASEYHALSRAFRLDGSRQSSKRSVRVNLQQPKAKAQRRRPDAFRDYRSMHWNCNARVGTPEFVAEEKRIQAMWRGLADAEKAVHEGRAQAKQDNLSALLDDETLTAPGISRASAFLGGTRTKSLRQELFRRAFEAIKVHAAWGVGLGLQCPSSALHPSQVLLDGTDHSIARQLTTLFGYDDRVVDNPAGTRKPLRGCKSCTWGGCLDDELRQVLDYSTYNVYIMLSRWKIPRASFPLCVSLQAGGVSARYYMLADTVGKGATVMLLKLWRDDGDVCRPAVQDEVLIIKTGQAAFRSLIVAAAMEAGTPPLDITECSFAVLDFKLEEVQRALAFRIKGVRHQCALPLQARLAAPRAATPAAATPGPKLPFGMVATSTEGVADPLKKVELQQPQPSGPGPQPPLASLASEDTDLDDASGPEKLAEAGDSVVNGDGDPNSVPSGRQVGLVAWEIASSNLARCYYCAEQGYPRGVCVITKGSLKFLFRTQPLKVEKSVHVECVSNGNLFSMCGEPHKVQSLRLLKGLPGSAAFQALSQDHQDLLWKAIDGFSQQAAGASSSSAA